ncbi:hypothetical protein R3W88_019515 [Solanum pinnatisectum]|uniref:Uncharacterized protein n=1 Tax=Solanum pinnatisectum TaxID=50273 RepID=A0AAV9KL30_9SOLN|nr:hypothetical protein R3W88_019515 [Solanum pinnatisectum]
MLQTPQQQHHGSGNSSPRYSGEGREKAQRMQDPQDNEINSRSSWQDQILYNEVATTLFEKNKHVADVAQVEKEALALAKFYEPLQVDFTSVGVVGDDSNMISRYPLLLHEIVSHQLTGITEVAVQINNQEKDGKREDKEEREGHQNINQLVKDADLFPHGFSKEKNVKLLGLQLGDDIYLLSQNMRLPSLVGGDFNVIMNDEEKIRVLPVYPTEYKDFDFCINSCDHLDINFKGIPFT